MSTEIDIKEKIIEICEELDILNITNFEEYLDVDLYEGGFVDSMSLTYFSAIVENQFGIEIPIEMFIAELRTINSIIKYINKIELTSAA